MPIFSITHLTDYRYQRFVAFGEHRMMLRPRDDEDQRVIQADLTISPKPQEVAWNRDQFNNHFAIARFSEQSDQLRVVSNIRLDHVARRFLASDIEEYARDYPFQYKPDELSNLQQFIFPRTQLSGSSSSGSGSTQRYKRYHGRWSLPGVPMSEPLVVSIPHHLGKEEALRRLKTGLAEVGTSFGHLFSVREQIWTGDHLAFRSAP